MFTEHFRGSEEVIKNRLSLYKPFIEGLQKNGVQNAVDLGCGRGEWMELLTELGIPVIGVDQDSSMQLICKSKNLSVINQDCLSFLQNTKSQSLDLITAFHFIEHIDFNTMRIFFEECYRTLSDKGVLVIETPNSSNPFVSANTFWIDPTHIRPVHFEVLKFLGKFYGFQENITFGIHPMMTLRDSVTTREGFKIDINQDLVYLGFKKSGIENFLECIESIKQKSLEKVDG